MSRFSGKYYYTIDPKGRVMMPAPFREVIAEHYGPKLMLTVAPVDRCLHIYPFAEWERLLEKVAGLPKTNRSVKLFLRTVIGSAVEVETDKQGRVMVPSSLRSDADLKGDLAIVGVLDKIEVWDKDLWERATDLTGVDAQGYEDDLSGFGI